MGIAKKIPRVQDFSGRIERVVVDQNRAEDGTLGFEVVRQSTVDGDLGHGKAGSKLQASGFRPPKISRVRSREPGARSRQPVYSVLGAASGLPSATTFT